MAAACPATWEGSERVHVYVHPSRWWFSASFGLESPCGPYSLFMYVCILVRTINMEVGRKLSCVCSLKVS